jgi:hypothetical protein
MYEIDDDEDEKDDEVKDDDAVEDDNGFFLSRSGLE